MEDEENSQGTETHVYRVEEFNTDLSSPSRSCSNINKQSHIIVSSNGNIIPVSSHVIVTSGGQFTLSNNKSIDLIGEEFVSKLKSEPEQDEDKRSPVVMSIASMNTETNTVSAGGEQSHLVYCNLNDLDLSGSGETYSLASLHSLAEASSTVQQQERNSYSNVSTILLQGGILQLKGEGGGGLVSGSGQDQILMTVDSKFGSQQDRMVPSTQIVTVGDSPQHTRPQDAIASILASMNSQGLEPTVSSGNPVDYSTAVSEVDEVVTLDQQHFEDRREVLPLNLATSSPSQGTFIQTSQGLQLHGIKKIGQSTPGGLVTKKVIIATINGTQRILTPVSSPQIISMKPTSRFLSDGTLVNGSSPIMIQKPGLQLHKPKQYSPPILSSRSTDNKTCLWKFENGQVCGKVFTKTYNLTVHMRMHQDIRPFPCSICEQTFRQKAHLQRHEATHGIDSTANRKRRKRPMIDNFNDINRRADNESDEDMYRSFGEVKRKFSIGTMKNEEEEEEEDEMDVDPMIEPIDGSQIERKQVCPVNVGTNTEVTRHDVSDEIEESNLEPVRYRPNPSSRGVEQGVQYSEEDLILPDSGYQEMEMKYSRSEETLEKEEIRYIHPSKSVLKTEDGVVEVGEDEVYSSQQVYSVQQGELEETQLITQTSDGSYIDTSGNQIVMSQEGELVGFVPVEGDQSQVVNISTTTNEHGQQVVIIENLHHHSPELQREIMNALISDSSLVPLTH